jgi:hypothetical protein
MSERGLFKVHWKRPSQVASVCTIAEAMAFENQQLTDAQGTNP